MSTNLLNCIAVKVGIPKTRILTWELVIFKDDKSSQPVTDLVVTAKNQHVDDTYQITKRIPYGDLLNWFQWEA